MTCKEYSSMPRSERAAYFMAMRFDWLRSQGYTNRQALEIVDDLRKKRLGSTKA